MTVLLGTLCKSAKLLLRHGSVMLLLLPLTPFPTCQSSLLCHPPPCLSCPSIGCFCFSQCDIVLQQEEVLVIRLKSLEDQMPSCHTPAARARLTSAFVALHGEMVLLLHWSMLNFQVGVCQAQSTACCKCPAALCVQGHIMKGAWESTRRNVHCHSGRHGGGNVHVATQQPAV